MAEWQPIESAPKNGRPILLLLSAALHSNDVHGYVPWHETRVVLGWWAGAFDPDETGWECCFMYDGAADTDGHSSQFFAHVTPTHWMPLPEPPQ